MPKIFCGFAAFVFLGWIVFACGSDSAPSDDSTVDATPAIDAMPEIDADNTGVCEQYCACMDTFCGDKITSFDACKTDCTAFTTAQRSCRTEHCSYAGPPMNDPATHCAHAAGEAVCD